MTHSLNQSFNIFKKDFNNKDRLEVKRRKAVKIVKGKSKTAKQEPKPNKELKYQHNCESVNRLGKVLS